MIWRGPRVGFYRGGEEQLQPLRQGAGRIIGRVGHDVGLDKLTTPVSFFFFSFFFRIVSRGDQFVVMQV